MRASSPGFLSRSDEELFNPDYRPVYETVETVPLNRVTASANDDDSEPETLATLPLHRTAAITQDGNTTRLTQPTQIIRRSSPDMASSPPNAVVQVAASSPVPATPIPLRKSRGILASAMAPAGTAFRRPVLAAPAPRQTITIDSDDEGPTYRGGSSDSDTADPRRNDIKTSTFIRKSQVIPGKIPESPQGPTTDHNRFQTITANAFYRGTSTAAGTGAVAKRSADINASAYGSVYKKPRQTGPSRAVPVGREQKADMELDDIMDYNTRQKVKRMMSMVSSVTVRECYEVLLSKKGNYDDAIDLCLQMSEERQARSTRTAIDLTGSEDELMPTPAAAPKRAVVSQVRQQAKVPQKSIAEKWSSTQNVKKMLPKPIDIFEEPPEKARTLVRGRKHSSSPAPLPAAVRPPSQSLGRRRRSDDEGEADSAIHSSPSPGLEDSSFPSRVLVFFNTCSAADLSDTAAVAKEMAEHVISKRPFRTIEAVTRIEAPHLKPSKGRRKAPPMGEKIVDKVEEMLASYEAVDYLVQKCENLAKPLAAEMKSWGVSVYGSQAGELDLVSLHDSQRSGHDSGIGTPVSDEDRDAMKRSRSRGYIGQPSIMTPSIQMKGYQLVGVNWLDLLYQKNMSCILADDMGLGKTCQVIAFLAHLWENGERGPHLVVVPAATLENWLKEFQRFCPTLNVEPYYASSPSERLELREHIDDTRDEINVVVTTYTIAKGKEDFPWLKKFGFCCTIFDEGHVLKNADSQVSRKLVRIESKFRLLLTGTPLQNNLKELISLLGFLMPAMFHEKREELHSIFTHNVKAMDDNHDALLSAQRIARARTMLTPFILRRKKYQVLKDLPKKERRVEYCDMTPEQVEIYQMWLDKAYNVRERRARGENVSNESSNILMKLRQAAIHPFLFRRLYQDQQLPVIAKQCLKVDMWRESNPDLIVTELEAYSDMEIHHLCDQHPQLHRFTLNNHEWLASGKTQKMLDLVRQFMADGHRTLIFSQFVMVLDILELVLEREAIAYFRLDGSTKVAERQDLIDEFCDDENDTPVFMLSTKAGGAGINLAKASKVIVFDSGFNPQDDIQAENRAHRIGQVKEVEVIRLVSKGTVEEQIYAMGLTKLKLDEQVAGSDGGEEPVKKEDEETEKEVEGRQIVEDMFFQKLDTKPVAEVKAELGASVTLAKSARDGKNTIEREEEMKEGPDVEVCPGTSANTNGDRKDEDEIEDESRRGVELPTRNRSRGTRQTSGRTSRARR